MAEPHDKPLPETADGIAGRMYPAIGVSIALVLLLALTIQIVFAARVLMGQVYARNGSAALNVVREDTALWSYGRAVQWYPNEFRWHFELGLLQRKTGDTIAAQSSLETALRLAPNYVLGLIALGDLHAFAGNLDTAGALVDRAAAITPLFWKVHYAAGTHHALAGRNAAAIESLHQANRLSPRPSAEIHGQLARAQMAEGDLKNALHSVDRAIIHHPGNPEHFFTRGQVLFEMRRYSEVAPSLVKAGQILALVEARGLVSPVNRVQIDTLMANAFLKNVQASKAAVALTRAARLDPDSPVVRNVARRIAGMLSFPQGLKNGPGQLNLGVLMAALQDYEAADRALSLAYPLLNARRKAECAMAHARVLDHQGRHTEAIGMIEKIPAADRQDPEIAYLHADLLAKAGRNLEAALRFRMMLESYSIDAATVQSIEQRVVQLEGDASSDQ